jgi:leucyl aminopeptidase
MKFSYQRTTIKNLKADALTCFVFQDASSLKNDLAYLRKLLGKKIDHVMQLEHFEGKPSERLAIYTEGKLSSPRLLIIGLGKKKSLTLESYRRGASAAAKYARSSKLKHVAFHIPSFAVADDALSLKDVVTSLAEGAVLSIYKYDKYFTGKDYTKNTVSEISILDTEKKYEKLCREALRKTKIVCEAVYFARDLENGPGNEIYPQSLAEAAQKSAAEFGYRAVVWDKKRIEQTGFGGLLAVNSGSTNPPRFIILEHNAGQKNLDTIVLVGKGVTFDSGGISIKPSSGMAEMKMDMSGAAAVIGTMEAASRLKLPVHLVGLIPATENMPSGSSMRPGDIVTHYGGKTSEVDNTDAEGRLILADALAYANNYSPKAVIDLATLTGACVVALGAHATGMMGNDDKLMNQLKRAGDKTFERVWELPLFEEYEKQIKSDVADVKNVGGRWAGAITAGLFLKRFIGDYKWVHLDIAGTAILEDSQPYSPKGGSGIGVRLLVEFLEQWNPSGK